MHKKGTSAKLLSNREQEVFRLLLQEKSNKEISLLLAISEKTVEGHLTKIYMKLGVRSRIGAILWGIKKQGISLIENQDSEQFNKYRVCRPSKGGADEISQHLVRVKPSLNR